MGETNGIVFCSLHQIDVTNLRGEERDIEKSSADLKEFVNELVKKTGNEKNIRKFKESDSESIVVSSFRKITQTSDLEKQLEQAQKTVDHFVTVKKEAIDRYGERLQKGSLFQAYVNGEAGRFFLISVVDHNAFLDEKDYLKHHGIPLEGKALKSCVMKLDGNLTIEDISVYDTNNTIAHYWWNNFLKLDPVSKNEENTKKSFRHIDNTIAKKIKAVSPRDYMILRSNLIGYYYRNKSFSYEGLIDGVFKGYSSENVSKDQIKELIEEFKVLPEKRNFDRRFDISKKDLSKLAKKTFRLSENMELTLKGSIGAFTGKIVAYEEDGAKYLKIRINDDKTFKTFEGTE